MQDLLNKIANVLPRKKKPAARKQAEPRKVKDFRSTPDPHFGDRVIFQLDTESLQYSIVRHYPFRATLIACDKVYIPRANNANTDIRSLILREIRTVLSSHSLFIPTFALSLSCERSAVRVMHLPYMSGEELRHAARIEGDKQIPFGLANSYWGYKPLRRITEEKVDELEIVLVATPVEDVTDAIALFREAGITFSHIYQDIDAVAGCLRSITDFSQDKTYGLINVHTTRTEISVYSGEHLRFLHRGPLGTIAMGNGLASDPMHAEMFPRLLENFVEGLSHEIQSCMDFYGAQTRQSDIDAFYIYGDLGYTDMIVDALESRFNVNIRRFPFEAVDTKCALPEVLQNTAVTVLPVCGAAAANRAHIDLTPADILQERNKKTTLAATIRTAGVAAVFAGLLWAQEHQALSSDRESRRMLETQAQRFEQSMAYAGYRALQQDIARQKSVIQKLQAPPSHDHLALKELSVWTPQQIVLDYFEYYPRSSGNVTRLAGKVMTNELAPETALASYVAALESSPLFDSVALIRFDKSIAGDRRVITFSLEMRSNL